MSPLSKIALHLVPYSVGAPIGGSEDGPLELASRLKLACPERIDEIPLSVNPDTHDRLRELSASTHRVSNFREVELINRVLFEDVSKTLERETSPLIFHGDDSNVIGIGASLLRKCGRGLKIVYFDAHADLNTPESSPSGFAWGMGLRVLLGEGAEELTSILGEGEKLDSRQILLIGTRSLDIGEREFIERTDLDVFPSDLSGNEFRDRVKDVSSDLGRENITSLYIHIDTDVFLNGAGVEDIPNGLEITHVLDAIRIFCQSIPIGAISVGNFNPRHKNCDYVASHLVNFFLSLS